VRAPSSLNSTVAVSFSVRRAAADTELAAPALTVRPLIARAGAP
jgi:hypothetical protein